MLHPQPHESTETRTIVEFRSVTCGYAGAAALTDVTVAVTRGDFVGIVGPSGAGKTTLLRAVLGAVDVYGGEIIVNGESVSRKRPRAGYVPSLRRSTGTSL